MKTIIIICVVAIVLVVLLLLLIFKKTNKEEEVIVIEDDSYKPNEADVIKMQKLNAGGFTAKKIAPSKVVAPNFKQGEPIGYKDLSHTDNTYGARVADTNNNVPDSK